MFRRWTMRDGHLDSLDIPDFQKPKMGFEVDTQCSVERTNSFRYKV
jgi:hypothetical protein